MDLIYMNEKKEDQGIMPDYSFDMSFGNDENNFQCDIIQDNHCCEAGFYLYIEGTECGGIIDDIEVDTDSETISYIGRTWHGILESKVIEPQSFNNLIPFPYLDKTKTVNGITWTVNDDGTVTANGTATADSHFNVDGRTDGLNITTEGKTYRISGCPEGGTIATTFRLGFGEWAEDKTTSTLFVSDIGEGVIFTSTEHSYTNIIITIRSGQTVENLTFHPMLVEVAEDGSYPTEYIQPGKTLKMDYLILSGEANSVLASLISRIGLSGLFKASNYDSGINISDYKMNRYISGYAGIRKMLTASGAKLNISFKNGYVELSARPLVDYSKDEQFDKDQLSFKIRKNYHPINHVICLGKGDLAEREVIHVYADEHGNISDTQVFTGVSEVTSVYDYPSAESSEELRNGGIDIIKESWKSDSIDFNLDSDSDSYDIGDIVGAKEFVTGIEVKEYITQKIITIDRNNTKISYKVGEE